ncbi:hypothetical protein M8360_34520, partial [Klebsiella pneumoniae]|nr:hypothetical protein [Klebsiella pneumoniae]
LNGLHTPDEMVQADESRPVPKQAERAEAPMSGRDWLAELDQCGTAEEARKLYADCAAARELTKEIAEQITTAGRTLAAT